MKPGTPNDNLPTWSALLVHADGIELAPGHFVCSMLSCYENSKVVHGFLIVGKFNPKALMVDATPANLVNEFATWHPYFSKNEIEGSNLQAGDVWIDQFRAPSGPTTAAAYLGRCELAEFDRSPQIPIHLGLRCDRQIQLLAEPLLAELPSELAPVPADRELTLEEQRAHIILVRQFSSMRSALGILLNANGYSISGSVGGI
jgi:hypothetical protein